jgi:hypothetical protein
MGIYVPDKILMPVGLDEAGLKYSMDRLLSESLSDYRRRLLLEARDPSDPTASSVIRNTNRKVGEFELPVFDIELVLDGDGYPVAENPYVEITSTFLRAYHDYDKAFPETGLDFEVSLKDTKWLENVIAAFSGSLYFVAAVLDDYYQYLVADHLRIGNTNRYSDGRQLYSSYQNTMPHRHISEIWFSDLLAFQNEVDLKSDVLAPGDYWVDYDEGTIISNSTQSGVCYYTYRQFPYKVYWQPVRVLFANDKDLDYEIKDMLVSDSTGELEPLLLNSRGSGLFNRILAVHPLGWGE